MKRFYLYLLLLSWLVGYCQLCGENLNPYLGNIQLDGCTLVWCPNLDSYLCTVDAEVKGKDIEARLTCSADEAWAGGTLQWDGQTVRNGGSCRIKAVDGRESHEIVWQQGGRRVKAKVALTFMPIVCMNVQGLYGKEYVAGSVRVLSAPATEKGEWIGAKIRYRGQTAMSKRKKAYAVKLYDEKGKGKDVPMLGMRKDNYWILDAAAVDPSMMRNRVSTDLWNAFAHKPYYIDQEPKAMTGTRGKFVEMVLNGEYNGIYCLTERIDRKQMALKKTKKGKTKGCLFKSEQWTYEVFFGHDVGNVYYRFPNRSPIGYAQADERQSEEWGGFEVKYPKVDKGEKVSWKPLWAAIDFTATASDETFVKEVSAYFDMPVLLDYYLFVELLLSSDNHGKNMYWGLYDRSEPAYAQRLTPAVWDLDGTWGARWDGSYARTTPKQDYRQFLDENEHGQWSVFVRMFDNDAATQWSQRLARRYAELRKNEFDIDRLVHRFADYGQLFVESGADVREAARWQEYHADLPKAVDYIKAWIKERVNYLDRHYGYVGDGIDGIEAEALCGKVEGGRGCVRLSLPVAQWVSVFDVWGHCIQAAWMEKGEHVCAGMEEGWYVVNGEKVKVE